MSHWVKIALRELAAGRPFQLRIRGTSLAGRIEDGETVTIAPLASIAAAVGDVVFVRLGKDRFLTHLVREVRDGRYLIGNNRGGTDGWVSPEAILGVVVRVGLDRTFGGETLEEI